MIVILRVTTEDGFSTISCIETLSNVVWMVVEE